MVDSVGHHGSKTDSFSFNRSWLVLLHIFLLQQTELCTFPIISLLCVFFLLDNSKTHSISSWVCENWQYMQSVWAVWWEVEYLHHTCQTSKPLNTGKAPYRTDTIVYLHQICQYYLDLILAQQLLTEKHQTVLWGSQSLMRQIELVDKKKRLRNVFFLTNCFCQWILNSVIYGASLVYRLNGARALLCVDNERARAARPGARDHAREPMNCSLTVAQNKAPLMPLFSHLVTKGIIFDISD